MMDPNQQPPNQPSPGPERRMYKFTADEVRVIKECNRESFYQRCLPIGFAFGLSTYYGVKTGYLGANTRFGAIPKVTAAVVVGYFAGKFSYQQKCAEKFMKLPNSQFGEMLRKRRQGTLQEGVEPGYGPSMSLGPFSGLSSGDSYSDIGSGSNRMDFDTSRPQYDGLDDSHRPSLDNPIYEEEEMPPVQKSTTSYDELRKQNRDEYQHKRTSFYPREPQKAAPSPPTTPPPREQLSEGKKNQYGDAWEL